MKKKIKTELDKSESESDKEHKICRYCGCCLQEADVLCPGCGHQYIGG